jgi:hypothetical protein
MVLESRGSDTLQQFGAYWYAQIQNIWEIMGGVPIQSSFQNCL